MIPIPDESLVIPLRLMNYNLVKFFLFSLSGEILITTLGASIGSTISLSLEDMVGSPILVLISVVLTIIATLVMVKADLSDFTERFMAKFKQV